MMMSECFKKLKETVTCEERENVHMTALPTKAQGWPLMLGKEVDAAVQNYITVMRAVHGVVTTKICMAAAEGVVIALDQGLLVEHGGHIHITKT